jgi:hypothetical protein
MKRIAVAAAAVLTLAWPAAAGAVLAPPGGGGGGGGPPACQSGVMTGDGTYKGTLPISVPNTLVQLSVSITNVNVLGFVGTVTVSTTANGAGAVTRSTGWMYPSQTISFTGPTYTTPWNPVGVPFSIDLQAASDAVALAYKVCL